MIAVRRLVLIYQYLIFSIAKYHITSFILFNQNTVKTVILWNIFLQFGKAEFSAAIIPVPSVRQYLTHSLWSAPGKLKLILFIHLNTLYLKVQFSLLTNFYLNKLLICCLLIVSKVVVNFSNEVVSKNWLCRIRHYYVLYKYQ